MKSPDILRAEDLLKLSEKVQNPAWREFFRELVARCPRCNAEGVPLSEESRESRLKREISEGLAQFLVLNDVDPSEVRVIVSYPEMQASVTLKVGANERR